MSEYWKIFASFFKIGLFTFGGGAAMMPLFRQELVEKNGYVTEDEIINYYAIGQCTPGIIAVNVATFTGYKIKKTKGAVLATLAVVLPSLIVIMALAGILSLVSDNQTVEHAFSGIRLGVIALVFNEVIKMAKRSIKTKMQVCIFVIILGLVLGFSFSPVPAVLTAAVLGTLNYLRLK